MFEAFPGLDYWLGADSGGNVLTLLTSLDLNRHGLEFEPGSQGRGVPAGAFCLPGAPFWPAPCRAGIKRRAGLGSLVSSIGTVLHLTLLWEQS
jgi:hypothetical protein